MKKIFFSALCLSSFLASRAAMPADSLDVDTTAVELKGVEIEARMQSTSSKGSTFIPTKQQREAAYNATDLLFRMGIPELSVKPMSTSVSTLSGEAVSLFIDYLPASEADINGMSTSDVRRIEVLEFPSDPRFQGAKHVVNFIMQKYEYGGYTKMSLTQFVPFQYTDFMPYSKFSYKKMTFDVSARFFDRRTHHFGTDTRQTYMLTSPEGVEYAQQRNLSEGDAHEIYDWIPVSFRAVYSGEKAQISNTVGFNFSNTPRRRVGGDISYGNSLAGDYAYDRDQATSDRAVSWIGNYYFVLPSSFTLALEPQASYERIHSDSYYATTLDPSAPIVNNVKESVVDGKLNFVLQRSLGKSHTLSLRGQGRATYDRLDYTGSSPYENRFRSYSALGAVEYAFAHGKWYVKVDGGLIGEWNDINGDMVKDPYPFAHLNASFSPDNHNSIRAYAQYATNTPGLSERSPNVLQSNEFMYITGDPDIANSRHATFYVAYNWMPSNRFQLSAYGNYYRIFDRLTCIFDPYRDGSAVIRRYATDGDFTNGQVGASAAYAVIPGKLFFNCSLTQNFFRSTGYYDQNRNPFSFTANLSWYSGPFGVYGYFQSRSRALSPYGQYVKTRESYQVGVTYRTGGWNFVVAAVNFLKFNWDQSETWFETPVFTQQSRETMQYSKCNLAVSVSYTFRYGKKINQGDEVKSISTGKSGMLK